MGARSIRANLGHESGVGFTLDQYAHARRETHDGAAAVVGGILDGVSEARS
jgi:hypothetical protein